MDTKDRFEKAIRKMLRFQDIYSKDDLLEIAKVAAHDYSKPLERGNVILTEAGQIKIVKEDGEEHSNYEFIDYRPHATSGFGYFCGNQWCRCCQ